MHRFYLPVSIYFSQFLRPRIPSLDLGTPQVIVNYLMRVIYFFLDIFQDTTCFKNLQGKKILAGHLTLFKAINICLTSVRELKSNHWKVILQDWQLDWGGGQENTEVGKRMILSCFLLCMISESFIPRQQGIGCK